MSVIRTYFTKNNTIVTDNRINSSQNPVTEISYGLNNLVSRYIFDVDLNKLKEKIEFIGYNKNRILSHKLKIQNTINVTNDYLGGFFQDKETQRTSSFKLDLFKIDEDWDEGNGYEFYYDENEPIKPIFSPSNWFYRKTDVEWNVQGIYDSGTTQIIGQQYFDNGNENLEIDVTDYVNNYIFSGDTTHKGFGLKFSDEFESLSTKYRQAVAFHTKYTHTFFRPYIETIVDDNIQDDRNRFYIDVDNYLYFFFKIKNKYTDVVINSVDIYDYEGNLLDIINGDNIEKIYNGVYRIQYRVNSEEYPDRVIFYDKWNITFNGVVKEITQKFYVRPNDFYYNTSKNHINPDNFHIILSGIKNGENINAGLIKPVKIFLKKLYDYDEDVNIYYSIYIKMSNNHRINIIEYELVDVLDNIYMFNIDTSWLIPQIYNLDIYIGNDNYKFLMDTILFKINEFF